MFRGDRNKKIHDVVLADSRLKVGVTVAHNLLQTQSSDSFGGVFGVVQPQYGRVFGRERNMESLQYTGDQQQLKQRISPSKWAPKRPIWICQSPNQQLVPSGLTREHI